MQRLKRTERMMVRWMCGVTLKDRKSSQEVLDRMDIVDISDRVRRGRLRWFGLMERKSVDDWVSRCKGLRVEGDRNRGGCRKTWTGCVEEDLRKVNLKRVDAQDRALWRSGI